MVIIKQITEKILKNVQNPKKYGKKSEGVL